MVLNATAPTPSRSWVAIGTAITVATLLYTVACFVAKSYRFAFFSIPVFVGFTAGVLHPQRPYRSSLYALGAALLLAVVTLREGIVCVLYSLPLLVLLLFAGAFSGSIVTRYVRTKRARRGSVGLMVLLAILFQVWDGLTDDPSRHPVHVAESEIAVEAPAEVVFSLLTGSELRVESRWPWFLRVGLPMPERMVVEKPGLDGRLRFDFSQGTAFARVTTWSPPTELAYTVERYDIHDPPFHITRLGRGPSYGLRSERINDWLTLLDTRYTMHPTPNGGHILRRRVVWRRHLAPGLYFGWLQQAIMERGQVRLLELIRERARQARSSGAGVAIGATQPRLPKAWGEDHRAR
jgi:hypothetical protein